MLLLKIILMIFLAVPFIYLGFKLLTHIMDVALKDRKKEFDKK